MAHDMQYARKNIYFPSPLTGYTLHTPQIYDFEYNVLESINYGNKKINPLNAVAQLKYNTMTPEERAKIDPPFGMCLF